MNNKQIITLVLLLAMSGCGVEADVNDTTPLVDDQTPRASKTEDAMQGGTLLSQNETMRSGVVQVGGHCTGSIVYTSAFERRTWVLTAAHCVCYLATGLPVFTLSRPGGGEIFESPSNRYGSAFVAPGFPSNYSTCADAASNPAYRDIALVRYDFGVTLENSSGETIREYQRPVWSAVPNFDVIGLYRNYAVLGAGDTNGVALNELLCGAETSGDDLLRWGRSVFGYASYGSWDIGNTEPYHPTSTYLRHGDSGGPWLTTPSGAGPTLSDTIEHGTIVGVSSTMQCGAGTQATFAASTYANISFLTNTMGADLRTTDHNEYRTCFTDWCQYNNRQIAALLVAVL